MAAMYCSRCVLPARSHGPFNEDGVCSLCLRFEKKKTELLRELYASGEAQRERWIDAQENLRGSGDYDALVMCSGGKDSTRTLYEVAKSDLRPLAFTFDHGTEPEGALENVKNATDALGVDWVYFRSSYLKDAFKIFVESDHPVFWCHVCHWYNKHATMKLCRRLGIRAVADGETRGQLMGGILREEWDNVEGGWPDTTDFVNNILRKHEKYADFPRSWEEANTNEKGEWDIARMSPFVAKTAGWDASLLDHLRQELNWEQIPTSYPHRSTNCELNILASYLALKRTGYTHYHKEFSHQIRLGEISRDEASQRLDYEFDRGHLEELCEKHGVDTSCLE